MRKSTEKNKEELTENEVLAVIMKAVKMREDSLAEFIKGKREDLIDQTNKELEILKAYLPAAMSDEELTAIIKEAIASVGATGPKEMGKVMKAVMPRVQGRADGKRINTIVEKLLQRTEEGRVGKEGGPMCESRWGPYH
jgi:uncharacterized protein YqeY